MNSRLLFRPRAFRSSILAALALFALALAGCENEVRVNVTGDVKLEGKPLNRGSVIFAADSGENFVGNIDSDGSFTIFDVAPGSYRVAVQTPKPVRRGNGESDEARPTREPVVPAPARYSDPKTSDLACEVTEESHTASFDLKAGGGSSPSGAGRPRRR